MLFSDFKFSHCIRAVTLLGGILISAVAQSHGRAATAVSYTHLTLPTKRIV